MVLVLQLYFLTNGEHFAIKEGARMKTTIALLSLGLVSTAFCLDEYMPMVKGKTEVDVGALYVTPEVGDAATSVPLQVKYGLMAGLDLELGTTYATASGASGLSQPQVAAKYAIGDNGIAVFVNVALPFATGDLSNGYKGLGIAPGLVYGKNYGKIQAVGLASYQLNMKDADDLESDNALTVYLKPGYMVSDKLAVYAGVVYWSAGSANSTTVQPGITYTISDMVALEANVPYVVSTTGAKSWGILASLYFTL